MAKMTISTKTEVKEIVSEAIDLHYHIGPEIIPRKYIASTLVMQEKGKIKGIALKNHFKPTVKAAAETSGVSLQLIGSIVLNNPAGGLSASAIRIAAAESTGPIIVWMPTINADNFLHQSEYEIPPEWLSDNSIKVRKADKVNGLSLLDENGALSRESLSVLEAIRECGAVLATGHISMAEIMAAVPYAVNRGQKAVIVTHPIYQRTRLPLPEQKTLAKLGCYLEHCYSMYSIDGISIRQIAKEIRVVGKDSVILSSDMGQAVSPDPSEALEMFAELLVAEGIPLQWIRTMAVDNPAKILELAKEQQ